MIKKWDEIEKDSELENEGYEELKSVSWTVWPYTSHAMAKNGWK